VQAERHVVGHRLDGPAQAVQHGGVGFHASVRVLLLYVGSLALTG
jgi:hypothetical protein